MFHSLKTLITIINQHNNGEKAGLRIASQPMTHRETIYNIHVRLNYNGIDSTAIHVSQCLPAISTLMYFIIGAEHSLQTHTGCFIVGCQHNNGATGCRGRVCGNAILLLYIIKNNGFINIQLLNQVRKAFRIIPHFVIKVLRKGLRFLTGKLRQRLYQL